jgi:hypothetical protein
VTSTLRSRVASQAVALGVAALVALAADCAPGGGQDVLGSAGPLAATAGPVSSTSPAPFGAVRFALVVDGEEVATGTLADTPAAREFAATLPVTVEMEDRFGQAKTGRLPEALPDDGADGLLDPSAGHLAYWAPDRMLAVVTTDLGPSVPEPGLVVLGVVDTGLDSFAAATDGRFEMTIEPSG